MSLSTSPPKLKRKRTRTTTNGLTINKQLDNIRKILIEIKDENLILRRNNNTLKDEMASLKSKIILLEKQNQNIIETTKESNSSLLSSLDKKLNNYSQVVFEGLENSNPAGQTDAIKQLTNNLNDLKENVTKNFTRVFREVGTNRKNVNEKMSYANIVSSNLATDTNETKKVIDNMKNSMEDLQQNISSKLEEENKEKRRQRKKNNVCVINIPEPNVRSTASPEDQDIIKIKAALENKIIIKQNDLLDMYRIGKKDTNSKHPRPIIIKFNNNEKRNQILTLRNLNYETNDSTSVNVYIAPDRTKKQQEEYKKQLKLRQERQNNKQDSSTNNAPPFRKRPQINWGI